jgi:hypothetical protein
VDRRRAHDAERRQRVERAGDIDDARVPPQNTSRPRRRRRYLRKARRPARDAADLDAGPLIFIETSRRALPAGPCLGRPAADEIPQRRGPGLPQGRPRRAIKVAFSGAPGLPGRPCGASLAGAAALTPPKWSAADRSGCRNPRPRSKARRRQSRCGARAITRGQHPRSNREALPVPTQISALTMLRIM